MSLLEPIFGDVVLSFPLPQRRTDTLRLTPAESEVLCDISRGLSNTRIAARRGVSVRTVANQVGQLFRKLGVHSRLDAMLVAGRWSPHDARDDRARKHPRTTTLRAKPGVDLDTLVASKRLSG